LPAIDTTSPYSTVATAINSGSTTVKATVHAGGNSFGTDTSIVSVLAPNPWWQVRDGDLVSGGDLVSKVPSGYYFEANGAGGYPGVPAYANTTNLTNSNASTIGWLLKNTITSPKVYDYQAFVNQIPTTTTINTISSSNLGSQLNSGTIDATTGYYWYKYTGPVDLNVNSAVNLGSRKVVLLVDSADLLINSPINLTDGQGFFLALVGKNSGGSKGNIIVGSTVGGGAAPNLEGLYLADNGFFDGSSANQLWLRGSLIAYGGVTLQRDLGGLNGASPAELFEYAPDQILLFPGKLGLRRINWKEVAP
jgi:hypothetical protein